jgi:hypothetical protein
MFGTKVINQWASLKNLYICKFGPMKIIARMWEKEDGVWSRSSLIGRKILFRSTGVD